MCIGWFGMSLVEAMRCTPKEFAIYMKARQFRRQERHEDMAFQAWKNREVMADKKAGKNKTRPYFKNFQEFYDSTEAIKRIINPEYYEQKKNSLADFNRMLAQVGKGEMNE